MIQLKSIVAIFIIFILYLCVWNWCQTGKLEKIFQKIDGNGPTEEVRRAVQIKPRTAEEMYQVGVLWDYNMGDQSQAARWYQRAVESAQGDWTIADRVGDRLRRVATQDDEHYGNFPPHDLEVLLQTIKDTETDKKADSPEDEFKVRQTWKRDMQNVHDSALGNTVASHYNQVKLLNRESEPVTIDDTIREITDPDAREMLQIIRELNGPVSKLNDELEPDIMSEIWRLSRRNPETRASFVEALKESWNVGSPVCVTGRTSRAIASLAFLVPETPQLGVLKTREVIRNEIFDQSDKILTAELSNNAEFKQLYMGDELDDEDQQKLKTQLQERVLSPIYREIDKYTDQLPPVEIEKLKEECRAAVN